MNKIKNKNTMIPFSAIIEIAKKPVKVIHINQSLARCSKNIEPMFKENRKEFQKSIQYSNENKIRF